MLIPAAAYYRMSRDKQEHSIAEQRTAVEAYAAKHGYRIIREYLDEGISGDATHRRLGFQKMLRDAGESGDFKVILCWDQDRFGRFDPIEGGYWIKPLRDAGVRLETVAQGRIDWNDFAGRLVYMIQQEAKHAYLRDLSRNTMRGHLAAHARGVWQGARPFGYRIEDKRLAPDDREGPIVRGMFERYAAGETLRSLAAWLNGQEVRTPEGKHWTFSNVRKLLIRVTYVGTSRYGSEAKGKYHHLGPNGEILPGKGSKGRHFIDRENSHPPIVDRELFDRVQRLLVARQKRKYLRETAYALSGLLRCGHCGECMVGYRKHPTGPYSYRQYHCSSYHAAGKDVCNCNAIREAELLGCVVRKLRDFWGVPANVKKLEAALRRECQRAEDSDEPLLRKRLAALNGEIDRGAKRLLSVPDSVYADLVAELDTAKKERAGIEARLKALERGRTAEAGQVDRMVARALQKLAELEEAVARAEPGLVRDGLAGLVSRIILNFRHEKRKTVVRSHFDHGKIELRPGLEMFPTVSEVPSTSW